MLEQLVDKTIQMRTVPVPTYHLSVLQDSASRFQRGVAGAILHSLLYLKKQLITLSV